VHVTYDPFYSPILQKMDNVFVQVGFNEEACRERLVCSMYKTPSRFSPHSNLISAELSRYSITVLSALSVKINSYRPMASLISQHFLLHAILKKAIDCVYHDQLKHTHTHTHTHTHIYIYIYINITTL